VLAARLYAPGEPLRLEELPLPEPSGSEVRIRVGGCGVCHTDLHIVDGIQSRVVLPRTLGHEVAGWIDAFGPEAAADLRRARLSEGDAVVVFGGWGCGACRECQAGAEQRCERSIAPGFQADGGYAEAMLVPHPRHLEPLRRLDPRHAAPLADAGATAHRAVARAGRWLTPGARVLVIGCGGVGGFVVQLLRRAPGGPDLTVAVRELDPARLERAARLGADIGLLAADAGLAHEALGGPADVVFDVVGTDGTLRHAAETVAPDGLVVLVGEAGGRLPFGFDAMPLEAWLTSVAWGSRADLASVARHARAGRLRWETERVPLREAPAAHDRLRSGAADGRIVLVPPGSMSSDASA
jgi:alcohol dehydrogenase, propanol-preferring